MPISALHFTNLGPFDEVEFEFDPHVNVFVGPNNCGKSTVLFALADISLKSFLLPQKLCRTPSVRFRVRVRGMRPRGKYIEGELPGEVELPEFEHTLFPKSSRKVDLPLGYCAFVPALRWSTDFRSKGPTQSSASKEDKGTSASVVRDAEVVQEIIELDYRAYRQEKPSMRDIVASIASIASEITEGFAIEFAGIAEDDRGLYPQFQTPDGKLPLDVLSQGTQSLIQWLARLLIGYAKHYDFPENLDEKPGILIIDEIDAHLHPSWQRRIIPAILQKFPSLQIFCSTHSPLMLAGLKAGQIHLLTRDAKGKVIVSRNETDIIGWSADEIITSFLGVDDATDLETQENLNRLQRLRDKKRLNPREREELESLRDSINQGMLSGPAGREVEQLAEHLQRSLDEPPSKRPARTVRASRKTSARRKKGATSASRRAKK